MIGFAMWHIRLRPLVLSLLIAGATGAPAEEAASPVHFVVLEASDSCGFFRGQAYGRGLADFTTEMLWACEAISRRREAGITLGPRLAEADRALRRYHEAITTLARRAMAERRRLGWNAPIQPLSAERQTEIAEETGALTALETIRAGF